MSIWATEERGTLYGHLKEFVVLISSIVDFCTFFLRTRLMTLFSCLYIYIVNITFAHAFSIASVWGEWLGDESLVMVQYTWR